VKPRESGTGEGLHAFTRTLGEPHGLDVSPYDEPFLLKAINRGLLATGFGNTLAHGDHLPVRRMEGEKFCRSLRISYGEFFRNPLAFALLEKSVLTVLVFGKGSPASEMKGDRGQGVENPRCWDGDSLTKHNPHPPPKEPKSPGRLPSGIQRSRTIRLEPKCPSSHCPHLPLEHRSVRHLWAVGCSAEEKPLLPKDGNPTIPADVSPQYRWAGTRANTQKTGFSSPAGISHFRLGHALGNCGRLSPPYRSAKPFPPTPNGFAFRGGSDRTQGRQPSAELHRSRQRPVHNRLLKPSSDGTQI